jgi:hypothetical protein
MDRGMIAKALRAYLEGGLSIVPINPKTKRPFAKLLPQALDADGRPLYYLKSGDDSVEVVNYDTGFPKGTWAPFQERQPTEEEARHWLDNNMVSMAVVAGRVSGGVEILDFDVDGYYERWCELVGNLADGLPVQRTGGGGIQVAWRCPDPETNQKLAWHPDPTAHTGRTVAIETRGEGGYAVLPPSLHPSGNYYKIIKGRFSEIPQIAMSLRNYLLSCARQLDQAPKTKQDLEREAMQEADKEQRRRNYDGDSVIDAYNAQHSIEEVLTQYGYTKAHGGRWSRPGDKDSAGVEVIKGQNKTYHYSSNDPLDSDSGAGHQPRSPFDYFLHFDHRGDYKSAVKAAALDLGMVTPPKRTYTNVANGHAAHSVNVSKKPTTAPTEEVPRPEVKMDEASTDMDVFSVLVSIAKSGESGLNRRSQVEELADHVGLIDPTHHGRLLKSILIADPSYTKTEAKEFIKACVSKAKKLAKERAAADLARRKAEQKQAALTARSAHTIVVGDRQLRDVRVEALAALVDMVQAKPQYPPVYVKVGALSRVVCDEKGIYSSQEIKTTAMPGLLSDAADWLMEVETATTYKEVNVFPPKDVAADILTLADWPGIPALGSIVNAPVFGKDGTLHSKEGYNDTTQLYYTGGVTVGDTTPTAERVAWAKEMLLTELMGNFPFKDDASRAHALTYLLSPFVREMINGPVPPTVFDAPTEGTGKSLLINVCTYVFLGHDAATMADTADDDEWRKRITSKLLSGSTHALIDNINREIDSGVLANVWTQPIWDDRTLGVNRDVKIPNRMIWALSANNIQLSRENTRRVVWCRLDANMERPATRSADEFRHPDLRSWLAENRDDLVTAALILVRAWLAAGRPKFKGRAKGSYESWAYIMGGILCVVGVDGFLSNEDELFNHAVTDADEMGEFIDEWWNKYADSEAGLSRHLFKLASVSDNDSDNELGDYLNLLGAKLSSSKMRGRQQQLGRLLDATKGRVYRGFKIAYVRLLRGEKMYRLEDHRMQNADGQEFEITL